MQKFSRLVYPFLTVIIGYYPLKTAIVNPVLGQGIDLKEIMKGDRFTGVSPDNLQWSINSSEIYFSWNPEMEIGNSDYSYNLSSKKTDKLDPTKAFPTTFYHTSTNQVITITISNGNLIEYNPKTKKESLLVDFSDDLQFLSQSYKNTAYFQYHQNVFAYDLTTKSCQQLTNFVQGNSPSNQKDSSYLANQQRELFDYIRQQEAKKEWNEKRQVKESMSPIYYKKGEYVDNVAVSADGRFVTFRLYSDAGQAETNFEAHITADGYTQRRSARSKVSNLEPSTRMGIYDRQKDTVYYVNTDKLPGIKQKPTYMDEYGKGGLYTENRTVSFHTAIMHAVNQSAALDIRSYDNKDRWIVLLDLETGKYTLLDHQHDEAWIGGPGIHEWNDQPGVLGWMDVSSIYYQSEETGYSHLYKQNVNTLKKTAMTSGNWEVHDVILSKNKEKFYILANKIHPGVRNGYVLNISDNKLTPLFEGKFGIEWSLSPDEKSWAIRYSTPLEPWELYVAENKVGAKMQRVTTSTTKAFQTLSLLSPEVTSFTASDGKDVYARIYKPEKQNGAAVLFVHGAGYLQNAHFYWSNYHREMLFHQLLVKQGYTVMDVDYRASEGYGRDARCVIYRHMGERDLLDYVDAKDYLVKQMGIDEKRVGIYGGSYGGFISIMAMCKTPNTFACGAALRSVTDWAHYNHDYTSNILNYPETDPKAYKQSSPIYFAEGLNGPLLMLHGLVDDNVQFQDVVRMNQRFIELGKKDFDLILFPTEAHGFQYAPAWYDEYRRIYELFDEKLK